MNLPAGTDFFFELLRLPNRRSIFQTTLLEVTDRTLVLAHQIRPSRPLVIDGVEVMGNNYLVIWFLFKGAPYDIGRVYRPDGTWTGYYVDVLEPVQWQDADPHTLRPLVDLFLDLWIEPSGVYHILDEDEFLEAEQQGHMTPTQVTHAKTTLDWLKAEVEAGNFPPTAVREFHF